MKFPESVPAKNFPDYEATNDGNIRSVKTGKLIKPQSDRSGFKILTLRKNGKQHNVRVGRLVADSFYEGDHSKLDVCYRDGDKQNTAPDNLIFRTRSETVCRTFDSGKRKHIDKVRVRIVETGEAFRSIRACAISLGDERYYRHVSECLDKPNKTFKGYHYISLNR